MKAMILAAGFGTRLRPLTLSIPKALVPFAGMTLIEYNIIKLVRSGINEIAINLHYLGEMIQRHLGDGKHYNAQITYFHEDPILGSGGAIQNALDFFENSPFVVISADIISDIDYSICNFQLSKNSLAKLFVVHNPSYHAIGDFNLTNNNVLNFNTPRLYTYSGIGVFSPLIFDKQIATTPLMDYLYTYIVNNKVLGVLHTGKWFNIGTLEELNVAEAQMQWAAI